MSERLLSFDPLTGLSSHFSYDENTDTTIIRTSGDSELWVEQNKARQNDPDISKQGIKDGMWLFASIPPMLQVKWLIEEGLDVYKKEHSARLFAKLADPEFRYLKCTTGSHR